MYLKIINVTHDKLIAIITLIREKLKSFPPKSRMRQGCPLSSLSCNMGFDFLVRASRQEKELEGIRIGKEGVKLFLYADDMILYLKDPTDSTKKFLDLI
jgi:hypothetical protein